MISQIGLVRKSGSPILLQTLPRANHSTAIVRKSASYRERHVA